MEFLRQSRLASGLNGRRIFAAWDDASGAAAYTLKKYFRDGKLYITLSSSVVRSQLNCQKALLLDKINAILEKDELFTPQSGSGPYVTELILK